MKTEAKKLKQVGGGRNISLRLAEHVGDDAMQGDGMQQGPMQGVCIRVACRHGLAI